MTENDLALALAFGGDLESARELFGELDDRFRAADDAPGQGGALIPGGSRRSAPANLERRPSSLAARRRDLGAAPRRATSRAGPGSRRRTCTPPSASGSLQSAASRARSGCSRRPETAAASSCAEPIRPLRPRKGAAKTDSS